MAKDEGHGMSAPEGYFRYWGKADPDYPEEPTWHPLVYHCLDVAAVAAAWWDQSLAIRHAFSSAFEVEKRHASRLRAWILFFTALHDIGKFDVRFQLKSKETLAKCWPKLNLEDVDTASLVTESFNHGPSGYAWAAREYSQWLSNEDGDYQVWDAWRPWLSAVTGHHGDLSEDSSLYPPDGKEYVAEHDRKARAAWIKTVDDLFFRRMRSMISDLPPTCDETAKMLLAGFCSISDWIGSHRGYFHYTEPLLDCAKYFASRVQSVKRRKLLFRIGLIKKPSQYVGIGALLEGDAHPRGIQVLVDSFPLLPGLTIIEAPTGSGKTEAALAYAWRLLENRHADSIVFALPTQATANAMLTRLEAFADKTFDGQGTNVVLAHEWWFSVSDAVEALTDSADPKQYIKKMRQRDPELNSYWGTICTPLEIMAPDGKRRETNCANTEGIFRIIQSIPSPKAEPFKRWLAKGWLFAGTGDRRSGAGNQEDAGALLSAMASLPKHKRE
ncbi:MAG: CRISPR-associated endonuclease Cas3'' [Thermodesulfobacteriota bacterium]